MVFFVVELVLEVLTEDGVMKEWMVVEKKGVQELIGFYLALLLVQGGAMMCGQKVVKKKTMREAS